MNNELRIHSFDPIFNSESRVLILGTMASPASLRSGMYYGHPQNAFWRILSGLAGERCPQDNGEKRRFLLSHGVALWDTLASCSREGALDSAIHAEVPNDIQWLLENCPKIEKIFLNGTAAMKYYQKYHAGNVSLPSELLPSSSPANAKGGFEAKFKRWSVIAPYLQLTE